MDVHQFQLQITRIPIGYTAASSSPPTTPLDDVTDEPHSERPSLVIPMVYDVNANITQLAERRDATGTITSSATNSASQLLRRYAELHKANAATSGECSIFPAIRELLTNYVMPRSDSPPAGQTEQQTSATTTTPTVLATNASSSTAATEPTQPSQPQSVPSQVRETLIRAEIMNNLVNIVSLHFRRQSIATIAGSSAKVTVNITTQQKLATVTN